MKTNKPRPSCGNCVHCGMTRVWGIKLGVNKPVYGCMINNVIDLDKAKTCSKYQHDGSSEGGG